MYKTQNLHKPEATRMSFHKQTENRDRLIFKVVDGGGAGGRNDPLRRSTHQRGSALTTSKLASESLKLPLMYQSGSHFMGEDSNAHNPTFGSVKKNSFDVKKRQMNTDE
jgi:hypothetical protein